MMNYFSCIGPTSFAPIIDAAIDIVEASNRQYHVLVIIADGQVYKTLFSAILFLMVLSLIFLFVIFFLWLHVYNSK